jgi:fused signal recognition particle receptor
MFGFFKKRKEKKAQEQAAKAAEASVVAEVDTQVPVEPSGESSAPISEVEVTQAPSPEDASALGSSALTDTASEAQALHPEQPTHFPQELPKPKASHEWQPPQPDQITEPVAAEIEQPQPTHEIPAPSIEPASKPDIEAHLSEVELQRLLTESQTLLKQKESVQPEPVQPEPVQEESVQEESVQEALAQPESQVLQPETQTKPQKKGFFARLKEGLTKTRTGFTEGIANLLLGKKAIDEDLLEELEMQLIMADVGMEATQSIIQSLTDRVSRKELNDSDALYAALKLALTDLLLPVEQPLDLSVKKEPGEPYVILVVGVNGVGKTTTIGKLAKQFQAQGHSVMLAAGDTFRAAAVEQLQVWGQLNQVSVVAQHTGADSASVIFDAIQSAKTKGIDVLIADTAGRLHNKSNLMQELEKVVRVMKKITPNAPHEVLLVLDACTGQNALNQAKQFQQAVGVSGLALTKLDGTAKGGIIFAIAKQLQLPVRFIGVGEQAEDLRVFEARRFVDALFDSEDDAQ